MFKNIKKLFSTEREGEVIIENTETINEATSETVNTDNELETAKETKELIDAREAAKGTPIQTILQDGVVFYEIELFGLKFKIRSDNDKIHKLENGRICQIRLSSLDCDSFEDWYIWLDVFKTKCPLGTTTPQVFNPELMGPQYVHVSPNSEKNCVTLSFYPSMQYVIDKARADETRRAQKRAYYENCFKVGNEQF